MSRRSSPDTLMLRSAGLNTRLDPERLQQANRQNGYEIEFAQAVNVSLDDRGLPEMRSGCTSLAVGSYHSVFCDGGDCFVIMERESDAVLLKVVSVSPFFAVAEVTTGLTQGLRMAWAQSGGDTFYSNTVQKGYIRSGIKYDWPVQTYQGPDSDMQFATEIPAASHIAFLPGGKVIIAVGSALFQNHAPFQYGLFHPARGNIATFLTDVTMLASTPTGFYASDERHTWYFTALESWYLYRQDAVELAPALTGSLAHDYLNLADLGTATGVGRAWVSQEGICIGDSRGVVTNLTKDKVVYPSGYATGASLIKDFTVIHTAS